MTTNQENYQPLINVLQEHEVDFVEEIQNILDYVLITSLSNKDNDTMFPLSNSTHLLILLRNAIKECNIERL